MKLKLTATESLLVVAQNRIDLLTGDKVAELRARVAELEASIEATREEEAKLRRRSAAAWDRILDEVGKAHGVEIPPTGELEADETDRVSIVWDDSPKPGTPTVDDDDQDDEVEGPRPLLVEPTAEEARAWDEELAAAAARAEAALSPELAAPAAE